MTKLPIVFPVPVMSHSTWWDNRLVTAMVCFKSVFSFSSWSSPKNYAIYFHICKMIISKCTSNLNMKRNKIKPMKTKHQTYQEWIAACLDCMFWLPRSSTGCKLQRDNTYLKRDFTQLSSIVQAQPSA